MQTFLISPVRGKSADALIEYVKTLETRGYKVHWPLRDTDQNDDVGMRICRDNLAAIRSADVVHIIWDGKSHGCLFDLGMAFALGKHVKPILLPPKTDHKSFQNMVSEWSRQNDVFP